MAQVLPAAGKISGATSEEQSCISTELQALRKFLVLFQNTRAPACGVSEQQSTISTELDPGAVDWCW